MDLNNSPLGVVSDLWEVLEVIGPDWQAPVRPEAPTGPESDFDANKRYKGMEASNPKVRKQYNLWVTKQMLLSVNTLRDWIQSQTNNDNERARNGANARYPHLWRSLNNGDERIRNEYLDNLYILSSKTANNILQRHLEYAMAVHSLELELKLADKDLWLEAMYAHLGMRFTNASKDTADALRVRRQGLLQDVDPLNARTQPASVNGM